jgi:hypothetical protein
MLQTILSEVGKVYYSGHTVSIGLCFFNAFLFVKFYLLKRKLKVEKELASIVGRTLLSIWGFLVVG